MEIWKPIKGYLGYYEVSSKGLIRSVPRRVSNPIHGMVNLKSKIIKQHENGHGYLIVSLNKNGIRKNARVHQLVAVNFLNHKVCGHKIVVDHINGNKKDNCVDNLRLTTNRENISIGKNKNKTSVYTGVCWSSRDSKWKASIGINKKKVHLGYFNNENLAGQIYKEALINIDSYNGDRIEFLIMIRSILRSYTEQQNLRP